MVGGYGIAVGINQGLEKVDNAFNRRSELQMLAQQQEQQRNLYNINYSNAEQNNKILMDKVAQLERDNARKDAFQAFDSFEAAGDTKYLNLAIKDNQMLKTAMDSSGITSISNIRDFTPEKLASLGYKEKEFVRPVVFNKADGTQQIGDLFTEYGKFGYLERANQNVLNDYKVKVEGLKLANEENKLAVGNVETDNYLNYVNQMIEAGKMPLSMKEFGKPPKTSSDGSDIKTSTQAIVKLAELNTIPDDKLTDLQREQKKLFTGLANTDSDVKRQVIGEANKVTTKFTDGVSNKPVTLEDVNSVTTAEALTNTTGDKATVKTLTDNFTTLKQGYKLVDSVNSLSNDEIERGIVDQGLLEAKSLFSDSNFTKLSTEEKLKTLKTVKFNTRLGSYLADYIRSISGTAASEAEFERLKGVLIGGSFNNIQTVKTAINEFVKVEDEKFKSNLDSKFGLAKGEVLRLRYNYGKDLEGKLSSTKKEEKPTSSIDTEAVKEELRKRGYNIQ